MKIGRYKVNTDSFAYDGCHKIYILECEKDKEAAKELEYKILPIAELFDTYECSCSLKFISNWQLNKGYVRQFKKPTFRGLK
jgi:hypothetical protein